VIGHAADYVVAAEDAPSHGPCAICAKLVERSSFCCGCGRFVCWTHGEPPVRVTGGSTQPFTPHALKDHTCGEATRAA
jgi:hypothetical protein